MNCIVNGTYCTVVAIKVEVGVVLSLSRLLHRVKLTTGRGSCPICTCTLPLLSLLVMPLPLLLHWLILSLLLQLLQLPLSLLHCHRPPCLPAAADSIARRCFLGQRGRCGTKGYAL